MTEDPRATTRRSTARPTARPVPGRRLPGALPSARLAARTAPRGAVEIAQAPRTGSLAELEGHKRALLVTYRRDGTPVPTPVWAASAGGLLYVRSERSSGKLKRLRNDSRLLIAPCTARGKPLGAPLEARADAGRRAGAAGRAGARGALRIWPRVLRAGDGRPARRHVLPGDRARRLGLGTAQADAAAASRGRIWARGAGPANDGGAMSR